VALDPLDLHLDRVAEPEAPAPAPLERRPEQIEPEEVAAQTADGQKALENLAEASKEARVDQADDLAG
jgi:hypothetical protein